MSERDDALELLDELARLLARSQAASIEIELPDLSVKVTRSALPRPVEAAVAEEAEAEADIEKVQRVHATTVGIFSSAKEWQRGDEVKRGTVLGAIQSLGHMADIASPADGRIEEVLVTGGAPVEYGQALFAISLVIPSTSRAASDP